jgi:hypothetical protein
VPAPQASGALVPGGDGAAGPGADGASCAEHGKSVAAWRPGYGASSEEPCGVGDGDGRAASFWRQRRPALMVFQPV